MLLQIPPALVVLWFITILVILAILLGLAIGQALEKKNEEGTAVKLPHQEWTRADIIGVVTVVVAIIGVVVAIAGIIIAFFMPELRRRLR